MSHDVNTPVLTAEELREQYMDALEKQNARLATQIDLLQGALMGLLRHCDPDLPPGPDLWNARTRALEAMRTLKLA